MADPSARPLDAEVARRAAALSFRARRAVEGVLTGLHRSPHRGASVVFVEHREYRPGDDPRLLDWRAFARSDRHVIKRFEQETQLRATLLLDRSGSMAWGGFSDDDATRKDAYAATLLAAFAYLLVRQGDAVGYGAFDVALHDDALPPASKPAHFEALLSRLAAPARPETATDLPAALRAAAERAGRRGVVVVASDLLGVRSGADFAPLAQLVARGHEVIVFHVLHPDELDLPIDGAARFVGLEGEPELEADVEAVREAYARELRELLARCSEGCATAGARYVLARTDAPAEHALAHAIRRGRAR
ncbi:MAG: DUF58 domain-containing protein [Myxococcales bacterium]|nr:DUF58 domain-containing protein [Myxococcales bacterium]